MLKFDTVDITWSLSLIFARNFAQRHNVIFRKQIRRQKIYCSQNSRWRRSPFWHSMNSRNGLVMMTALWVLIRIVFFLYFSSSTEWSKKWYLCFNFAIIFVNKINSLLHSVNLIVFTLLLAHLILRISPSVTPSTFHYRLKTHLSFTNPFLHSHSYSFRTDFTDLNVYCIKGALALFVLVSFSGYVYQIKLNTQLSSPR